jgi:hypothetical protein
MCTVRAGFKFAWPVNRALLNRAQPTLDRDSDVTTAAKGPCHWRRCYYLGPRQPAELPGDELSHSCAPSGNVGRMCTKRGHAATQELTTG